MNKAYSALAVLDRELISIGEFKKRVEAEGIEFCDCWAESVFSMLLGMGFIRMNSDWRDSACMIGLTETGLDKKEELRRESPVDHLGTAEQETHLR